MTRKSNLQFFNFRSPTLQPYTEIGRQLYQRGFSNIALGAGLCAGGVMIRETILLTTGSIFMVLGAARVGQKCGNTSGTTDIKKSPDYQSEDGPL
jgi:hypothetical protein